MEQMNIKSQLIEFLRGTGYCSEVGTKDDPTFYVDAYVDYRDEMDEATAIALLRDDYPESALVDRLDEWYGEQIVECREDLREKFIHDFYEDGSDSESEPGASYDLEDLVDELLMDLVFLELPCDHFMDKEYCVNIMLDTGDGNYDYVLNSVYPAYCGSYDNFLIEDKAGLAWLAKQQGYTKSELKKALRDGEFKASGGDATASSFLKSVRTEVANVSTHMNTLTFLTKMSFRQCVELNKLIELQERDGLRYDATKRPYCGYIVIDRETRAGLFDPWSGAGSIFDIEPDKDVRIPIRFIRSAMPDGADGYGVRNVYGVCSSWWEAGGIKCIHAPSEKTLNKQ